MAKNQNTFEKMRRELDKKRKAEDKRARRERKKVDGETPEPLSEGDNREGPSGES